jgi:hypothetical protein
MKPSKLIEATHNGLQNSSKILSKTPPIFAMRTQWMAGWGEIKIQYFLINIL